MFVAKTPQFVQFFMPGFHWRVPSAEKVLYLTFDDGPIPEVTPWVLDTLKLFQAKATFFCVGDNVRKHPEVFEQVLNAGHSVGNHTFNHLNGWKTADSKYLDNVAACQASLIAAGAIKEMDSAGAPIALGRPLFRPPYGLLKLAQKKKLSIDYDIVMWDVLSGDFSKKLSPQNCLDNVLLHAQPGSIVLMHDSLKAAANVRYMLPKVLDFFSQQGFRFEGLNPSGR